MVRIRNQAGFGGAAIILAIAVIGLLAAASFLVLRHNHPGSPKVNTDSVMSQTATTPVSTNQQQAQQAQKYLTIKEWGIAIPYSSSDTYTYALSAGGNAVEIGSEALASTDAACTNRGAGVILRFAPTDAADTTNTTTVAQAAKQYPNTYVYVNGYYYLFMHTQSACGNPVATSALSAQLNDQVKAALSKLNVTSGQN